MKVILLKQVPNVGKKFEEINIVKFHHMNSISNSKDLDKLLSLINKLDL